MAIYTFGLTVPDDLEPFLPYDLAQLGASSTPINDGVITDAFNAGCAKAVLLGEHAGITVDAALATSDEEAHDVFKRAAIAYMKAEVFDRDGKVPELLRKAEERYADLANEIAALPGRALGNTWPGSAGVDVDIDDVGGTTDTELGGDWDMETDGATF